jgi:hypothetical protein
MLPLKFPRVTRPKGEVYETLRGGRGLLEPLRLVSPGLFGVFDNAVNLASPRQRQALGILTAVDKMGAGRRP